MHCMKSTREDFHTFCANQSRHNITLDCPSLTFRTYSLILGKPMCKLKQFLEKQRQAMHRGRFAQFCALISVVDTLSGAERCRGLYTFVWLRRGITFSIN